MRSPTTQPPSSHLSVSRASATGSALRRGDLKISDPMPLTDQTAPGEQSYDDSTTPTQPMEGTWPRKSTPPSAHVRSGSTGYREPAEVPAVSHNDLNRMSMGPSIIQSSMSTLPSKASLNQRNPRGFRAAIRRLFGSKRHTTAFSEARKVYHRSDPGNLTSNMEKEPIDHTVAQTPSQPASAVTRTSALGSHSPFAIADDRKESRWRTPEDWRSIGSRHKRRNTLPSVVLSQQEAEMIANALRPGNVRPDTEMETPIDTASGETSKALKRHSRSADALKELAQSYRASQTDSRGRSDEIAYWRNSAILNPVPSFGDYKAESQYTRSSRPPTSMAPQHKPNLSQATISPMQTFDFGLPAGTNESTSLEQRVGTLEVKVVDFEYAIAKLQGHDISRQAAPTRTPKRRSIHELFPTAGSQTTNSTRSWQTVATPQAHTTPASANELTFLSSSPNSPISFSIDGGTVDADRSSGATTIRPSTTHPKSPRRSPAPSTTPALNTDHFETLLAMIKEEQAARRRLEARVRELQREIDELRAPVYAYIRPAGMPTPSPESTHNTPIPVKGRALHRQPAFAENQRVAMVQETSRFSMTDSMLTDADADEENSDNDDGFQDVFETPQETKFRFSPDVTRSARSSPLGVI